MRTRSTLLLLAGLIGASWFGGCGESSQDPPEIGVGSEGELVDVGTHRLRVECRGEGSPMVMIDVGIGESYDLWQPIIDELSQITTVCIYDRAGYRESDPGPHPRTVGQSAHELHALLEKISAEPPHILVGHSLGALNVMLLAAWEAQDVAGLVLLDPPPRDFIAGRRFPGLRDLAEEETAGMRQGAEQARERGQEDQAVFLETVASEHEALFQDSAEQIGTIDSFGDLPLIVVASGVPNPMFGDSAEAFQEFWIESNRKLAGLSRAGEFILAAESEHHIHRDAPQVVLDAIQQLLVFVREMNP